MNNVIKIKKCIVAGYDIDIISQEEMNILWDYITNLQEENERLKQFYHKKDVYSLEYDKETLTTMICEKQNIIDKTLKYCELFKELTPRLNEVENILKGELL